MYPVVVHPWSPALDQRPHAVSASSRLDVAGDGESAAPSAASKKGAVPPEAPEPYNREKYKRYAADKGKAFRELYAFCFALAKPPYVPAVPYVVLS